ncbi:MAG: ABC transporter permease [Clostridia bacterium]|nr:ABC transporter permease [Clostridia bacterium]
MLAIYKREMRAYFTSPIGYIFIGLFLAVSGILFSVCTLLAGADSDVNTYFTMILYAFIIVIPFITMRSFAEERKQKTEQLLLTSPVSIAGMVAAKFLAAFTLFLGTFLVSCLQLSLLGKYTADTINGVNYPRIWGNIFAVILVGAACIAIGIFISSLTENQIVAAVGTISVLLLFFVLNILNSFIDSFLIRTLVNWFSVLSRYMNFTYGIFDFTALLYYFSICVVFLFLAVRVFEKRRWS